MNFQMTEFVKMPWEDNTIIMRNGVATYSRWELIHNVLKNAEISTPTCLVDHIKSYNSKLVDGEQVLPNWKFEALLQYFSNLTESERQEFFKSNGILSTIRSLALELKVNRPNIKVLKKGYNYSVTLHQVDAAGILGNAFFCTFPPMENECPAINFNTLFEGASPFILDLYVEKIKCIMNYFRRIHLKRPTGSITYYRVRISHARYPRFNRSEVPFCCLKVQSEGKIETQSGCIQTDFANKYIGGGVLKRGLIQEEIRFLMFPELIAARLFTECLSDNEAAFVVGAERYSQYTGYSTTFKYAGNYYDCTPTDNSGRKKTYVTVIDAFRYVHRTDQYRETKILRELKKAFVGFKLPDQFCDIPIATGNWGCGAFGGDPQLKSIIQLMASSEARRDMLYLTFGDVDLKEQLEEIHERLIQNSMKVGDLYNILKLYLGNKNPGESVFDFLLSRIGTPRRQTFPSEPRPSTSRNAAGAIESFETEDDDDDEVFPPMNLDFRKLDQKVHEATLRQTVAKDILCNVSPEVRNFAVDNLLRGLEIRFGKCKCQNCPLRAEPPENVSDRSDSRERSDRSLNEPSTSSGFRGDRDRFLNEPSTSSGFRGDRDRFLNEPSTSSGFRGDRDGFLNEPSTSSGFRGDRDRSLNEPSTSSGFRGDRDRSLNEPSTSSGFRGDRDRFLNEPSTSSGFRGDRDGFLNEPSTSSESSTAPQSKIPRLDGNKANPGDLDNSGRNRRSRKKKFIQKKIDSFFKP